MSGYRILPAFAAAAGACAALLARAPDPGEPPYGIDKRIPWTTSRVVGSPDPPPPYRVRRVFEKLTLPCPMGVYAEPGTGKLILLHQLTPWVGASRILRIPNDPGVTEPEILLKPDRIVYGIAFDPDYRRNGLVYVGSNGPVSGKEKTTRVSRFRVGREPPHKWDADSEEVIIEWKSDGHNGGDLAFGPDGMLYVTSGDGTSDSDTDLAGQDLPRLLSKVLRIDPAPPLCEAEGKAGRRQKGNKPDGDKPYSVPRDNPFVGREGVCPETWAYGFRNPWRLHIDQETGDVWVGNNGQDLWEQIYLVERGANYGWSVMEGSHPFYPTRKAGPDPFAKPIAEHHHSEARSLTGGVVYRGDRLPELRGAYVYGDWSTGRIWGIRHRGGKVTWHALLADTPLQITGFGMSPDGELLIADHGGGFYKLEPAPKVEQPRPFPTRLSETGLFESVKEHRVHPGLIPYSVNAPLWSDGADKERYIAVPGDGRIEPTPANGWNFPDGTVLVKTFSLETADVNPGGRRRIETRLLTRQQGEWAGYTYLWNDAQTDAELVGSAGTDRTFRVRDDSAPGGVREQVWHFPSRAECMVCHSRAANFVLGPSTAQMDRAHDYGGVSDNQLRTLEHIGMFKEDAREHLRNRRQPLADPADESAPLELRARSYLHANCSQCHVPAGGGNAAIDLAFTTKPAKGNLLGVKPNHHTFGVEGAKIIDPGHPERSVLYLRMTRRGEGQMPPLASSLVDRDGAALIHDWIAGMKP